MASDKANLRQERDRFVAFAFSAAELLLELDNEGRILYATGANQHMTGQDAAALHGGVLLDLIAESDRRMVAVALSRLGASGRLEPVTVRLAEGSKTAVLGACRLPFVSGRCFVSLARARAQFPHLLDEEARDAASGAWSQEQFKDVVTELVLQGNREGRHEQLTVLQLDGLDELAERAGADAVQELMGEAGAVLRTQSVGGDAVGRLSETKYGIVHDTAVPPERLVETIDDLSRSSDPSGIGLFVAKGCVDLANHGMNAEDIGKVINYTLQAFAEHDVATVDLCSISDAFDRLVNDTASRLANLKQTVTQQEFHIAFQPIVSLSDKAVKHYEVLSRFNDTPRPAETVLFAEQVGMIEELDLAVCQFAISVILERAAKGEDIELAINVSGRSLGSGIFVRLLGELLNKLGENRSNLLVEVTETARLENLDEARRVLQMLRDQGHAICLDDFGSGAASFQYMQALPIDYVKIDGSYVQQFLESAQDAAIVRSMISLSRELGLKTIAEMVETEAQATGLKKLGVDYGQGWLFGKPQRQVPTTGKRKTSTLARAARG